MKKILDSCIIAFAMYSKIPMPKVEWTRENMRYAMCFFPLVGCVIGGAMLLWCYLGGLLSFGRIFNAAVMVMIPVLITGGIHLDGLLDTSDALSSFKPMEQKLEILKDSHAGAFAIIVGIGYFLLLFGCYSEIGFRQLVVLAIGFVLSRAFSGLAVVTFRLAKNTGLAATFSDMAVKQRVRTVMVVYIVLCGILMILLEPILGTGCFLGMLAVFAYYRIMSYGKFGGITGDLAGFFLQISELVMAFVVVVVYKFI